MGRDAAKELRAKRRTLNAQKRLCAYCERPIYIRLRGSPNWATWDHVFPLALGYGNAGNRVLACLPCNQRKGAMHPCEFFLTLPPHIAERFLSWPEPPKRRSHQCSGASGLNA